jgi:hypothetical protein
MQFEEFDKKAKEAADHHHPAYDEQAWAKMEKLLNKHLPEKEDDNRRFLFFFLLLLLGLGGAGLFIAQPWKGKKSIAATEQNVQQKPPAMNPTATGPDKEITTTDNNVEESKNNINTTNTFTIENNKSGSGVRMPSKPRSWIISSSRQKSTTNNSDPFTSLSVITNKSQQKTNADDNQWQTNETKGNPTEIKETRMVTVKNAKPADDVVSSYKKQNESVTTSNPVANSSKPEGNEQLKIVDIKSQTLPIVENKGKKEKSKIKKGGHFFFTLSTGPDASFAGGEKFGTTKFITGGGIGYSFSNRLTLRTGFYTGRKVYTASSDAYHPPAEFYTYYPYLEKVDADCKVYEIPISLSYNFGHSTKQNWFAGVGLSSLVMKKEVYNYAYKYSAAGTLYHRKWTVNNENNHFLSTLTLSGGYQRNISKHISIMAEPYLKLPLTGVGYGKVKLNSGGVLFSIGIKPFGVKKGKPGINK